MIKRDFDIGLNNWNNKVKYAGRYRIVTDNKKDQEYLFLLAHSLSYRSKKALKNIDGFIYMQKFQCQIQNGGIVVKDISKEDHPICMEPY